MHANTTLGHLPHEGHQPRRARQDIHRIPHGPLRHHRWHADRRSRHRPRPVRGGDEAQEDALQGHVGPQGWEVEYQSICVASEGYRSLTSPQRRIYICTCTVQRVRFQKVLNIVHGCWSLGWVVWVCKLCSVLRLKLDWR